VFARARREARPRIFEGLGDLFDYELQVGLPEVVATTEKSDGALFGCTLVGA
jgi:hypothetical protein